MINFVTEGNCRLKKNTLGVPIRSWALLQYLYNFYYTGSKKCGGFRLEDPHFWELGEGSLFFFHPFILMLYLSVVSFPSTF